MELTINADDFGLSSSVNQAIDICIKNKWIHRTTIIVNMRQTEEAVNLAEQNGYMEKVGLHINLVEGIPLTEKIRHTPLCDADGQFNGLFFKKLSHRFYLEKEIRKAIEEEVEAQIKKFIACGFEAIHIDSHQHSHTNVSVFSSILRLALKYNFKSMRLSRNLPVSEMKGIKNIYKKYINRKIIRFNNANRPNQNVRQFFGSEKDCKREDFGNKPEFGNAIIEMMVHPTMLNGKIFDSCTNQRLFGENYTR